MQLMLPDNQCDGWIQENRPTRKKNESKPFVVPDVGSKIWHSDSHYSISGFANSVNESMLLVLFVIQLPTYVRYIANSLM